MIKKWISKLRQYFNKTQPTDRLELLEYILQQLKDSHNTHVERTSIDHHLLHFLNTDWVRDSQFMHEGFAKVDNALVKVDKRVDRINKKRSNYHENFKNKIRAMLGDFIQEIDEIKKYIHVSCVTKDGEYTKLVYRFNEFDEIINNTKNYDANVKALESLAKRAEEKYNEYIQHLRYETLECKKSISEYKETDKAILRLASLEARLTQLELSHGSGSATTSGSIRTYQNGSAPCS
jgi:hypothetical protein